MYQVDLPFDHKLNQQATTANQPCCCNFLSIPSSSNFKSSSIWQMLSRRRWINNHNQLDDRLSFNTMGTPIIATDVKDDEWIKWQRSV